VDAYYADMPSRPHVSTTETYKDEWVEGEGWEKREGRERGAGFSINKQLRLQGKKPNLIRFIFKV
jgi:hypothetical protein